MVLGADAIEDRHLETTGMFTGICVWGGAGECVYVVCWSMWCLCVDICGVGLCGVVLRHLGVWVCVTSLRGARMTPENR